MESRIREITIEETWEKEGDQVYWMYRFPGQKEWNRVLSPYNEIPWVRVNPLHPKYADVLNEEFWNLLA